MLFRSKPGAILVVEFYGESETELTDKPDKLKEDMARRGHGYACVNVLDRAAPATPRAKSMQF